MSHACVRARAGAALILALLLLVVLDCVVLGTLQLAILERRLAENAAAVLRLRLAAEGAAQLALRQWTVPMEELAAGGGSLALPSPPSPDGLITRVHVERLSATVFLLRAEAAEAPPRHGRTAASLLVRAPALPPGVVLAQSAVAARGVVDIRPNSAVTAPAPQPCADSLTPHAVLVLSPARLRVEAGAQVAGAIATLDARAYLASHIPRMHDHAGAVPGLVVAEGDALVERDGTGVLVTTGSITVAAGAGFRGLLIAGGNIVIAPGAAVTGAIYAAGDIDIRGTVALDRCAVGHAIEQAGLRRPAPAGDRVWLPTF